MTGNVLTFDVSVLVPLSGDDQTRAAHWAWCAKRYPVGWDIIVADDPTPELGGWSKGRAVDAAAKLATTGVFLIADADVWVSVYGLLKARQTLDRAHWVVPHTMVYRLSRHFTAGLVAGNRETPPVKLARSALERSAHRGPAGGGMVMLTRAAYETVGGIDPRFHGWGGDDISFARALETLVGPHRRLDAPMWHLAHTPMPRVGGKQRGSPENEQLAAAYLDATGDQEAMRELVQCHSRSVSN